MLMQLKNLSTFYGNKKIIDEVDYSIRKNKITTIIGPSGCGKSTLLMTISGLASEIKTFSMKGEILYEDNSYTNDSIEELIGKLGMVFQQPLAFPMSIYKNMIFATKYLGIEKIERERILENKLKEVNLWEEVKENLHKKATRLSGGQQQRLCIARALTVNPKVLLLDEPCSSLDVKNTQNIESLLIKLKEKYTIVMVTHNLAQAKRISDEVVFLNEGKLIEAANHDDFFNNPKEEETKAYIGGDFG